MPGSESVVTETARSDSQTKIVPVAVPGRRVTNSPLKQEKIENTVLRRDSLVKYLITKWGRGFRVPTRCPYLASQRYSRPSRDRLLQNRKWMRDSTVHIDTEQKENQIVRVSPLSHSLQKSGESYTTPLSSKH